MQLKRVNYGSHDHRLIKRSFPARNLLTGQGKEYEFRGLHWNWVTGSLVLPLHESPERFLDDCISSDSIKKKAEMEWIGDKC